jgi:hypothetical protein
MRSRSKGAKICWGNEKEILLASVPEPVICVGRREKDPGGCRQRVPGFEFQNINNGGFK